MEHGPLYWTWAILAIAIGILTLLVPSPAQEHNHGINVPDWYDADCCNLQDCRPVPDEEIEFGIGANGQAIVIHKPTGLEFERSRWRVSQDERYHACYRVTSGHRTAYCVYLRGGA